MYFVKQEVLDELEEKLSNKILRENEMAKWWRKRESLLEPIGPGKQHVRGFCKKWHKEHVTNETLYFKALFGLIIGSILTAGTVMFSFLMASLREESTNNTGSLREESTNNTDAFFIFSIVSSIFTMSVAMTRVHRKYTFMTFWLLFFMLYLHYHRSNLNLASLLLFSIIIVLTLLYRSWVRNEWNSFMKTSKGKFHLGNLVLSMLTIFMFICYAIHFAALRFSTHKDENNNTVINFDSVNVRNDFLAYPFNNDTKVTNDNVQTRLNAS